MIDISTLKEYIKVLEECSLEKLEISDGKDTISLEKAHAAAAAPAAVTVNAAPAPAAAPAVSTAEPDNGKTISAPIVGVFYAAPSPDKPPFVKVGDEVHKGDVIMIIESMKLMNEVQSDFDGKVTEILVEDGQAVEFDQPIMIIK